MTSSPRPGPSLAPTSLVSSLHEKRRACTCSLSNLSCLPSAAACTCAAAAPPLARYLTSHTHQAPHLGSGRCSLESTNDDVEQLEVGVDDESITPQLLACRYEAPPSRHVPEPQDAIDADKGDEEDVLKRSMAFALKDFFGIAPKLVHVTRQPLLSVVEMPRQNLT
ncbi:hypothetical protein BC827DRAFT_1254960 [Russula dissimulans]|nr:hypothetical protein BC827DRAFT_1254960 [Russula dissimulans]